MSDLQTFKSTSQPLTLLMARYAAGSDAAFAELHDRLRPVLHTKIQRWINNLAEVHDLVQIVFLRAHCSRQSFVCPPRPNDHAVIAWYLAIARNATFTHLRKCYRERAVFDRRCWEDCRPDDLEHRAHPLSGAHLEGAMVRAERDQQIQKRVRQAVQTLKPQQRIVIERKLSGESLARVAEALNVPYVTIRVRAHRGYKTLARQLEDTKKLLAVG